jgi:xanthine phosphoribosyltransferase
VRRAIMKLLEDRIVRDGKIFDGDVLKVDSFVNHQIDVKFISELGREFHRLFADQGINKILTIEASGIGIACLVAHHFDVPVVFAKKSKSINISADVYSSKVESYTHGKVYDVIVSKEFLGEGDRVLIIDDFLAKGSALKALISLTRDAGAEIVGAGIIIEKAYQGGGDIIRNEYGVRVESLARIESMSVEGGVKFC